MTDLVPYLHNFAGKAASGIGIRFSEPDVRKILSALTRVESRTRFQSNNVPRLHAVDYMNLVIRNIMTGKHTSGYKQYHPRYKAWESQYGLGHGYWKLMGDLVKNVNYRRVPVKSGAYAWFSGVPAGVMAGGKSWFSPGQRRGKKKEIAWTGKIMEGIIKTNKQNHPARPMFKPTLEEYKGAGAGKRGRQALVSLKRHWR